MLNTVYSISIRRLGTEAWNKIGLVNTMELGMEVVETKIAKTPVKWEDDLGLNFNKWCHCCEVVESNPIFGSEKYKAEIVIHKERVFESIDEIGA